MSGGLARNWSYQNSTGVPMSVDANSMAQARKRSSWSSGKKIVGLDWRMRKSRWSRSVPFSHAQSKARVSFFSRIVLHRSSRTARSAGSTASFTTIQPCSAKNATSSAVACG